MEWKSFFKVWLTDYRSGKWFTFDKFALSDIFHHEFCSWNFVASLSYVDFIRGREREEDKKVGLDREEAKCSVWSILFREDYVKTSGRTDRSLDIVYFAYSLDDLNVALIQSSLFICIIDFTIREEISAKDILISGSMNMIGTIFWQMKLL